MRYRSAFEECLGEGFAAADRGDCDAALTLLKTAIECDRTHPHAFFAHFRMGALHGQLGRLDKALASYDQAIALNPRHADSYGNRGVILTQLNRLDAALADYDAAMALRPRDAQTLCNRGVALMAMGRRADALASYELALAIDPACFRAHYNRGNTYKALKQFELALESYDQAIAINPTHAPSHCNRGVVLYDLDRLGGALSSYDRALALRPDYADAHCNRGNVLKRLQKHEDALASYESAIRARPGFATAYENRAYARLTLGDFAGGFADYEWRWKNEIGPLARQARSFHGTPWLGEASLAGRTILLVSEQGLGDTIQFCRYAPLLAERGATVVLQVQHPLRRLLTSLHGVAAVVTEGEATPRYDRYVPLLSAPLAFGTTLESVPSRVPYLCPPASSLQFWRKQLGTATKLRVGLAWSGGFRPHQPELWSVNRRRNIPLSALRPLLHPQVEFVSLQKGQPAESELAEATACGWEGPSLRDFSSRLEDFAETAALIEQLDLVICVDTSVAHLAGALGKPVWILNRYDTCWRWLLHRSDSPWYPTARIYRQEKPGDWNSVVDRVRADLFEVAAKWNPTSSSACHAVVTRSAYSASPAPDGSSRAGSHSC